MRRCLLLLSCLLCLAASPEKHELTGIVLQAGATSYTPVVDAEVELGDRTTRTDSAGSFKFADLATGVHEVTARKDGAEARGKVVVNSFAPAGIALFMVPAGTTMHGMTPLKPGTVYVGLSPNHETTPQLDNIQRYPAMIINGWADFMRLHGGIPFDRMTPVTTAPGSLMMIPPNQLPATGYSETRGYAPVWLAFRPDGKRLYVTCSDGLIRYYDPAAMKVQGSIPTPEAIVTDLACNAQFVAVSLMSASSPGVLIVDTATHGERKNHEVFCGQPQALAFAPDGMLLVAGDAGAVVRLDPVTGKVLGTGPVGSKPTSVALSGDRVYVVNSGSGDLSVLTYPELQPAGRVRVGTAPRKVLAVGNRLFVSLSGSGSLAVLDANGPMLLATPEVGAGAVGLASDGALVYVTCHDAGTVCGVDARTSEVVFTTSPQPMSGPYGVAVHP